MLRKCTDRGVSEEFFSSFGFGFFLKKNFIVDCNLARVTSVLRNRFILMCDPRNITSTEKLDKNIFLFGLGFNEE